MNQFLPCALRDQLRVLCGEFLKFNHEGVMENTKETQRNFINCTTLNFKLLLLTNQCRLVNVYL